MESDMVKELHKKFESMSIDQIETYVNEQLRIARETDNSALCIVVSKAISTYFKLNKFIVIKEPMMV